MSKEKNPQGPIADLRRNYTMAGLARADLAADPFAQFGRWFGEAQSAGLTEPNAAVLATADADGRPSSRTVLLKGADDGTFHFYTNYESRKGSELSANPFASLTFPWIDLERQVTIRGRVEKLDRAAPEAYFHSRPRGSQIGAWTSEQSTEIPNRGWLEQREREFTERFEGGEVPLPDFWGGFAIRPEAIEFWQGRPGRIHDRFEYQQIGEAWKAHRLSP